MKTGTLKELNVQAGDVVEVINHYPECTIQKDGKILIGSGPEYFGRISDNPNLVVTPTIQDGDIIDTKTEKL